MGKQDVKDTTLLVLIILCTALLFKLSEINSINRASAEPKIAKTPMQSVKLDCFDSQISGISMTPYFNDGDIISICNQEPKVNESIVFNCLTNKCLQEKRVSDDQFMKFVKKKKSDCYWLEGTSEYSFDSRDYGWLCKKKISMS